MAKVLVHVARNESWETAHMMQERYRRAMPRVFLTKKLDPDRDELGRGEFWEIEEGEDADALVRDLTRINPGVEVRTYMLVQESIRPAGELVTKKVTKEGVLPT